MADKILNARVRQKADTEANFMSENPILLEGEMAVSTDKGGKYKVGDGVNAWNDLAYNTAEVAEKDVNGNSIADAVTTSKLCKSTFFDQLGTTSRDLESRNGIYRRKNIFSKNISNNELFLEFLDTCFPNVDSKREPDTPWDVCIGDYINISDRRWTIAAFNYLKRRCLNRDAEGDPQSYYGKIFGTGQHITLISDPIIASSSQGISPMGPATNGYAGSYGLVSMKYIGNEMKNRILGDYMISIKEIVSTNCGDSTSNGPTASAETTDAYNIFIPSCMQILGYTPFGNIHNIGSANKKLPLFNFEDILNRQSASPSENGIYTRDCCADGFYYISQDGTPKIIDTYQSATYYYRALIHVHVSQPSPYN